MDWNCYFLLDTSELSELFTIINLLRPFGLLVGLIGYLSVFSTRLQTLKVRAISWYNCLRHVYETEGFVQRLKLLLRPKILIPKMQHFLQMSAEPVMSHNQEMECSG